MPTYSSSTISATLTQTIRAELLFPIPISYELPEAFFISEISQADADDQAEFYFNELTASTDATAYTVQQKPGVSATTVVFTHELKFEDTPVYLTVGYLNSGATGIITGTTLYYDSDGKFKVLNGFYNEKLSSGYYSVFYETLYGVVTERYFMLNNNSTSVTAETTGNVYNLVQTQKDYTSSWYFASAVLPEITYDEINNLYGFNQSWSTNDFYNNQVVRRGFVDNPNTYGTLYLWDSNFNLNSYSLAPNSYYREIPDIFNLTYVTYTSATTLTINSVQNCSEGENNGIYFRTVDSAGNNSPSLVGVSFQVSIYTASTFDSTHTIVIGNDTNEAFLYLPTSYIGQITSVNILSYNSPNPENKVTFTAGTFTACNVATATPTPVVSPSNSPTPSITPTNTLTPSITVTKTVTVTPTQTQLAIQYNTDLTNYATATLACRNGIQGANNKYMSPSYLAPESGAYVYNESSLSTLYDGGDQYHRMFRGASSWAVRIGTGGLISDVVDCSTIPSDTPTPTPTATPTITPTNTITPTVTPSTSPLGSSIQLSTPQNDECVACRLTSYSQTRYVNPSDSTPTIGDIVYQNVELTTVFNGNSQWFKTSWGSPTEYSIQIATNGQVLDVTNCSTCPTQTPSPTETPTPTPTSIPESPTPTPTVTETPTETPTPTPTSDPYFYYNTSIYSCGINSDCPDPSSGSAILRFTTAPTDTWFVNGGTAYEITSPTTGPAYTFDADLYGSSNSCITVCNP